MVSQLLLTISQSGMTVISSQQYSIDVFDGQPTMGQIWLKTFGSSRLEHSVYWFIWMRIGLTAILLEWIKFIVPMDAAVSNGRLTKSRKPIKLLLMHAHTIFCMWYLANINVAYKMISSRVCGCHMANNVFYLQACYFRELINTHPRIQVNWVLVRKQNEMRTCNQNKHLFESVNEWCCYRWAV